MEFLLLLMFVRTMVLSICLLSFHSLVDTVGEACLPNNAYFPWTPDYTPFILGLCLSEHS